MKSIETRMKKAAENNHRWYHFKDYSVRCVALYPLMVIFWYCHAVYEKIQKRINSFYQWNEERACRIITKEIIRHGELQEDGIIFYYLRMWGYWWFNKYHCKIIDRAFCHKFENQITEYFVNKYQIADYIKEVDTTDRDWYKFTFTKKA